MKRRPDFPPLPLLLPEESEERKVLASLWATVQPVARTTRTFAVRQRSARGVEAMSLRLRQNAHRYLQMLQG